MAGQLKIGGNVIATHAGTEGAGTVTLDSSTLTIGSNTTVTMGAGSIGTAVTMSANQPAVKTALNASGDAPIYACRAWMNSNGTGTVAIRDSGNVSSITDLAVGVYTVNFTTDMPHVNYSALGTHGDATHINEKSVAMFYNYQLGSVSISFEDVDAGGFDIEMVNVAIFC